MLNKSYNKSPDNRYFESVKKYSKEEFLHFVLNKMTLKDKIGQMYQIVKEDNNFGANIIDKNMEQAIRDGETGIILGEVGCQNLSELQRIAVDESPLGIPLLFNADVIHGYDTIFPVPLGMSCSFDVDLIEQVSHVIAVESTTAGVHWNNAPMIDISRDPRWGRCTEGSGEDPYLCSEIAKAQIKGFHGNGKGDRHYMMACAKHFVGYGSPVGGRDYDSVDMSNRTLYETYLPPFKAAIESGVDSIMPAFNTLNGIPCTVNNNLLKEIGRDEFGFDGIYISDYGAVEELIHHGSAEDQLEAARLAISATIDVEMVSRCFHNSVSSILSDNDISLENIDKSVLRILENKYDLGLFHNPFKYLNPDEESKFSLCAEHRDLALEISRKSIVLLENKTIDKEKLLPFKRDMKIALLGPFSKSKHVEGAWAFVRHRESFVTLEEGILSKIPSAQLETLACCTFEEDESIDIQAIKEVVDGSDVVVLTVGETVDMSGEARSYTQLKLPGQQHKLIKEVVKLGKPVVLVLFNGRPIVLKWYKENIPAIVETWFLGTESGNAIADVLFGDYNPSGKLSMSFPHNEGQIPVYYNKLNTGRPLIQNPSDPYRSKYMDVPNEALYSFGYGLSYTEFIYSDLQLSSNEMTENETLTATIRIENTGQVDGDEIVQLYLRDCSANSVSRPLKELKAFKRVSIKKKESVEVCFEIDTSMLTFYRKDNTMGYEYGKFIVFIGGSSDECMETEFNLKE